MNTNILEVIKRRRTVKPERYTGQIIPNEAIEAAIEAANWAPTHGFTEPWRFIVFEGEKKRDLLNFLNNLDTLKSGENEVRDAKRAKTFDQTSHIIAIAMKRGENPKIPEIEELLATAMAVQNLWLAADSLGFAGYWSTGAVAFSDELRIFLELDDNHKTLGFFYAGITATEIPEGRRFTLGADKTRWW